ncbi:hypothetical protein ACU6TU_01450 [Halomonas sp. LS-001]
MEKETCLAQSRGITLILLAFQIVSDTFYWHVNEALARQQIPGVESLRWQAYACQPICWHTGIGWFFAWSGCPLVD